MTYRILLWADHRQRDLMPLCATSLEIEKIMPDSTVGIISFDVWRDAMTYFKPHVVVMNHLLGQRNKIIANWVRNSGGLVVVLPTEGRVGTKSLITWATRYWDTDLCDLYLSWSDMFKDELPDTVNARTVGFPRGEFYYPPYSQLTAKKIDICNGLGLDPDKPIYTVASSFPTGKFAYQNTAFLEQDWKDLRLIEVSGREHPTEFAQNELRLFNEFFEYIQGEMLRKGGQWVIKPHPAEDITVVRAFCTATGATIMLNSPVNDLLRISDRHYARMGCITLGEAWMLNVPTTAIIDEISDDGWHSEAVREVSETVTTSGEVLPPFEKKSPTEYLNKWMGSEYQNSSALVAKYVVELLNERKPVVEDPLNADWERLHLVLTNHDNQFTIPQVDAYGQFGKSITQSLVSRMIGRMKDLNSAE